MKTVLIVDDGSFMRMIIRRMFERNSNYKIIGEAIDGEEAVELFKSLKPDIVTMDINMPRKNGLDALAEIMAIEKSAKVIMITSLGMEANVKKAIELGASGFVVKPFEEAHLYSILENLGD
ncbi:MAG: response regulator [Acholeplasmatales bacterium]|jgi:two-component system chemotaxis response regulator CheY|nr:response regulator [Acholeplasmatales bacterium]